MPRAALRGRERSGRRCAAPATAMVLAAAVVLVNAQPAPLVGARDPAWAPDGRRLALSILDRLWTFDPDGGDPRPLARWPRGVEALERDPAWSRDGRTIAFSARTGAETGFDLYLVDAREGTPRRVTTGAGDERWPSWTPNGALVFAAHERGQWDLFLLPGGADAAAHPERLTDTAADDLQPAVSPDGRLVAFVSTREAADGARDLWLLQLSGRVVTSASGPARPAPEPLVRERGAESAPAWSPDGTRLAYAVTADDGGSIRVVAVDVPEVGVEAARPAGPVVPTLVSRTAGEVAWSPDGRTLLVTDLVDRDDGYNGQPRRATDASSPAFPSVADLGARFLDAPAPPDASSRPLRASVRSTSARRTAIFDAIWDGLARRYFAAEPSAAAWRALRDRYRPLAVGAADDAALEEVTDALIAAQPPIRPAVTSTAGLVVSAHPLASEAGARVLRAGGNAVDAAVAVSFALGVVEPDASGIGGDGMALVWPSGAPAPVVVDFKDQVPAAATLDNPAVVRGGRLVEYGPASINVPGVVAGMDHLHRRRGSGRVPWADLLAPAIAHAAGGFVLDETLPATVAEAQVAFARSPAARTIFLPGGRPPQPGERFVNADYASTLRVLAAEGADTFYRGALARRMVDDLARHGGLLRLEDLEGYRVVERTPVRGLYRGHVIFSTPPPVSSGTALIEILQTFDRHPVAAGTRLAGDADAAHVLIETFRQVHAIRGADPAYWPDDSAAHLDQAHARDAYGRIDPRRASRRRPATADDDGTPSGSGAPGPGGSVSADEGSRLGRGTSAFAVVDRDGTVVVVTQTLSTWGGSFYVSEGLGFLYNNHLRMARTRPGSRGQLTPGARSASANASTIVAREVGGRLAPRLVLGAAGSAWIVPSVVGVVSAVVDGGLDPQAAVEAPRLRLDDGGAVHIEDRFPRALVADLVGRGHVVSRIGAKGELRYGFVSAIGLEAGGRRAAGADPRRSHVAVAVP
jgi:gamma-glutamyltranspeptidase